MIGGLTPSQRAALRDVAEAILDREARRVERVNACKSLAEIEGYRLGLALQGRAPSGPEAEALARRAAELARGR